MLLVLVVGVDPPGVLPHTLVSPGGGPPDGRHGLGPSAHPEIPKIKCVCVFTVLPFISTVPISCHVASVSVSVSECVCLCVCV